MALMRTQLLYWGQEVGGYGTVPIMAATDAHLVYDLASPVPSAVRLPRPVMMGGRLAPERVAVLGRKTATLSFRSELKGATGFGAAQPPDYHALLEACGFVGTWAAGPATWTYLRATNVPASTAQSLSLLHQIGESAASTLHQTLSGCRGDAVIEFVPGEVCRPQWTFSGLWSPVIDVPIGVDYTADVTPPVVGSTSFAPYVAAPALGAVGQIRRASLALRNNVTLIPGLHNTTGPGLGRYDILGYGPADDPGSILSIDVEAADAAALDDWLDRWTARTVGATGSMIRVGTAGGNRTTITFGRLEVVSAVPSDFDGVFGYRVDLAIKSAATADATNSDVTIVAD